MTHDEMLCKEYNSSSIADERAYQRDELIYNITEDILVLLEDLNISKKELARRLGKSQSYVTQTLSGSRNMTLSSLSDICFALGKKVKVNILNPKEIKAEPIESRKGSVLIVKSFNNEDNEIASHMHVIEEHCHLNLKHILQKDFILEHKMREEKILWHNIVQPVVFNLKMVQECLHLDRDDASGNNIDSFIYSQEARHWCRGVAK